MRADPVRIVAALIVVILLGPPARAQTISRCLLNVTPVRFGSYNPFSTSDMRANGTVTYNCTASGPIRIAMNRGGSNSPLARRMVQGVTPLEYNLYLDAALTRIWGDRSFGTDFYSESAARTNENVNIPVYGRVPPLQRHAKPGAYFDTVVVSIEF